MWSENQPARAWLEIIRRKVSGALTMHTEPPGSSSRTLVLAVKSPAVMGLVGEIPGSGGCHTFQSCVNFFFFLK